MRMSWRPDEITFDIVADDTDDPVVTITASTPAGLIAVMAEVETRGRTLRLHGVHVHSEAGPNAVGLANLRLLARIVLERMDYDAIEVEGAVRTTGAGAGRRPRAIRFARDPRPAPRR
jgi:hypothetical protein